MLGEKNLFFELTFSGNRFLLETGSSIWLYNCMFRVSDKENYTFKQEYL